MCFVSGEARISCCHSAIGRLHFFSIAGKQLAGPLGASLVPRMLPGPAPLA